AAVCTLIVVAMSPAIAIIMASLFCHPGCDRRTVATRRRSSCREFQHHVAHYGTAQPATDHSIRPLLVISFQQLLVVVDTSAENPGTMLPIMATWAPHHRS